MNTCSHQLTPRHPGATLREDVLPALGLTIETAAAQLDVSVESLTRVLDEKAPITAELAVRIEAWVGVNHGGDANHWMRLQAQRDIWLALQRGVTTSVSPAAIPSAGSDEILLQESLSFCGEFEVSPPRIHPRGQEVHRRT